MYSKEQASKLKTQFWTSFGQYMKPVPGTSGLPVNWINYKTGIKNIRFRMDADNTKAIVAIEITHANPEERAHYYTQFLSLKTLLENTTGFSWQWDEAAVTGHQTISSISQQLQQVNIFNQSDWPGIISFLKPRIMALDEFWELVKDGF
ncbi:DUF4268 domain-containing protein [Ferruginibacter sp.]